MRTDIDVYDQLLEYQAQASFGLERRLFEFDDFERAGTIVDLGCGNASYAARLALTFPDKRIVGVEPDAGLLARAHRRALPTNLKLIEGSFDTVPSDVAVDVVIARLMTMYVRDLQALAASVAARARTVVVLDPADDLFHVRPALPLFNDTLVANIDRIAGLGGHRDVQAKTVQIWTAAGLELADEQDVVVQSSAHHMKPLMHLLMVLNAELVKGTPLDLALLDELHGWVFDEGSYLQYGLRARRFVRPSYSSPNMEA